jgi:hypothetical protein
MFSEIGEQGVHPPVCRCVDHWPTLTPHWHEASHTQSVEVEGQCVRGEIEGFGNLTRSHALRPGLHKQPEHLEAVVLSKCRQGRYGIRFFHISTNIE